MGNDKRKHHGSRLDDMLRIEKLEAALRRIADQDFDGPQHLEGACAAEIAREALQNTDRE